MKLLIVLSLFISQMAFAAETCFNSNAARNWRYDHSTQTLVIRAGATYNVKTYFCHELPWARSISFRSFFTSRVCRGDDILVMDAWNEVREVCRIESVTRAQ